jgi:hypothetical protein
VHWFRIAPSEKEWIKADWMFCKYVKYLEKYAKDISEDVLDHCSDETCCGLTQTKLG